MNLFKANVSCSSDHIWVVADDLGAAVRRVELWLKDRAGHLPSDHAIAVVLVDSNRVLRTDERGGGE